MPHFLPLRRSQKNQSESNCFALLGASFPNCFFSYRNFSGNVCTKLTEMIERLSVPVDMKLKFIFVCRNMNCDSETLEKVCRCFFDGSWNNNGKVSLINIETTFLGERLVSVGTREVPLVQVRALRPPHDDSLVQEVARASRRSGEFAVERTETPWLVTRTCVLGWVAAQVLARRCESFSEEVGSQWFEAACTWCATRLEEQPRSRKYTCQLIVNLLVFFNSLINA